MLSDHALTGHARSRSQQRSVPPFVAGLLLDYGATMRHEGADVVYVDKSARRRLRAVLGDRGFAIVEPWLNVFAVVAENGSLITVGRRKGRLKRP